MKFIVQYLAEEEFTGQTNIPSINLVEADNLAILQNQVEATLKRGDADGAVIYTPQCTMRAERRVSVTEMPPSYGRLTKVLNP